MKTIVQAILIILFFQSCSPKKSQILYGEYYQANSILGGDIYSFSKDGTFRYWHRSDDINSNKSGVGKYIIDKKKLKLTYGKPVFHESNFQSKIISKSPLDSIIFSVKTRDVRHKILVGVSIILEDKKGEMLHGFITDWAGYGQVILPKSLNFETMRILYTGMKDLTIDISDKLSKTFSIKLAEKSTYLREGKVLDFNFKKGNRKLILKKGKKKAIFIKQN